MGKHWRGNLGTSCKMAGGLGEEDKCKAKIKLIFKGAPSDTFIDKFDSIDMNGMGFKLSKSNLKLDIKEKIEDLGIINNTDNGYIYELKIEHTAGQYLLITVNDKKEKPLFYITGAYVACAMSKNKDIENIVTNQKAITIPKKLFSTKYMVKGYINIVIELALNIRINCKMEGASENLIAQEGDKKSAIIPLNYKSKTDKAKGYFERVQRDGYDNMILERKSSRFNSFLEPARTGKDYRVDYVGFIATNYRKKIYKGKEVMGYTFTNEQTILSIIYEGQGSNELDGETFRTNISDKFFHTEGLQNRVYVLLESNGVMYHLQKEGMESAFRELKGIIDIKDFKKPKEMSEYIYNKHTSVQHDIFIHLLFDGKKLYYKDIVMQNTQFENDGKVK